MNTHVNFETAKLLKKKGFGMDDENYIQLPRFYEEDGTYVEYNIHMGKKHNPKRGHLGADTIEDFEAHLTMMDNSLDDIYLAPTIADTVMWLYEKYEIWIEVRRWRYKPNTVNTILKKKGFEYVIKGVAVEISYDSPTEAYEAAIEYTLKHSI